MRTPFGTTRAVCRCALLAALLLFPAAAPEARAAAPIINTNPRDTFSPLAPSVDHSTFSDSASNNDFTVSGPVQGSVYGGIAVGDGIASANNKVRITGTDAAVRIGWSTITGSGVVVGGWSRNGVVTGNTVTISSAANGVQVDGIVYGGQVNENIGQNLGSEASYNHVTLSGASATSQTVMRNNIYGAYSGGTSRITGNTVTIGSHVTVHLAGGIIAGGYDSVYGADAMEATGNRVAIQAGALVEGTAGNHISIYGGRMHTGNASGNRVDVTGGTINHADIYGGQNNNISDGYIASNMVALTGGTLNDVTIHGGYAGRRGDAHHNTVEIGGANTAFTGTVDVYGGRSGSGAAFGNTITIGADATAAVAIGSLYGGYVASGGGRDAFSGNSLTKNSERATIGEAHNLQYVTFGYAGAANIGLLDTTPTGSAAGGVTVINERDVTFDGRISGTGFLQKSGAGTLTLTNNNDFDGGTRIERGTLDIGAADAASSVKGASTVEGHITFVGPAEEKKLTLSAGPGSKNVVELHNSIRTESGAGKRNHVYLASPAAYSTTVTGVTTSGRGGAFFVAQDTGMDVTVGSLGLKGNKDGNGLNLNDLHVEAGGTFTLRTGMDSLFASGISGAGTLTLMPAGTNPYMATVTLWTLNDTDGVRDTAKTFEMGATRVEGTEGGGSLFFSLNREKTEDDRVTFTNAQSFMAIGNGTESGYAAIALGGDGVIKTPTISITDGAALMPFGGYDSASQETLVGTLTLDASASGAQNVSLQNFALVYQVGGAQKPLGDYGDGIPTSNNGLLNIQTGANTVDMQGGEVFLAPVGLFGRNGSSAFDTGKDYLIIRTNNGFNGTHQGGNPVPTEMLHASLYGTVIPTSGASAPRGAATGLKFGGDPDTASGNEGAYTNNNANNIWYGHGTLSSLTMDWTGDGGARGAWLLSGTRDDARDMDVFSSLQTDTGLDTGIHEHKFLGGDKVHISGDGSREVELARFRGPQDKIMVSGLVVGRNAHDQDAGNGSYTISGAGGITANSASAFGQYADDTYTGNDKLVRTGKLEKFGPGTLTFTNTGVNTFLSGIDLHAGTTRFTRADQLNENKKGIHLGYEGDPLDPGNPPSQTAPPAAPSLAGGTTATIEALNDVTLGADIGIAGAFTGTLGAAANTQFTYTGRMTGYDASSILSKAGAGVVTLAAGSPDFPGNVQVGAGTLRVAADYGKTAGFTVHNGATLSGTGSIGSVGAPGVIAAGGTLRPDGMTRFANAATAPDDDHPLTVAGAGGLRFDAGGNFAVRIAQYGGRHYSDWVRVNNGPVTIDSAAKLTVALDFWGGRGLDYFNPQPFTVINAENGGTAENPAARFQLALDLHSYPPRGVSLLQGWNDRLYQLRFIYDPDKGFGAITDNTHNQTAVGDALDDAVRNNDPGMWELIDRLSDPGLSDARVRGQLDQLSGDLTANALYLGFKEPWRHPFNRLDSELGLDWNEDAPRGPRVWAEASTRYGRLDHDGNARGFTMYRNGVAFGADTRLSRHAIVGAAFRYTRAHLEQSNGDVYADDFEAGLYGLGGLPGGFFLKGYFGLSYQQYEFNREVSLPATTSGKYGPLAERLDGDTRGHALATSLELTRPVPLLENFRILPLAALDYERVWMQGYRESAGQTALRYDDASLDRLMFRFGLKAEYNWGDRLDLKGWAQYAAQSGGRDFSAVDARFAAARLPHRPMDIRGSRMGRDYLNLGFSADWKFGEEKNTSLYVKYDAKLYRRMREHAGEFGLMLTW